MRSEEETFIFVKWIMIIGLAPLLYLFFGSLLFMIVGGFIDNLTGGAINVLLNKYVIVGYIIITILIIIAVIGFFVFVYFLIQREKKKPHKAMKKVTGQFTFGVSLIFMGNLGLVAFYALMIYGFIQGGGSISGIFFIPIILWMILFYSIGFSIVNKQRLLERFREQNELRYKNSEKIENSPSATQSASINSLQKDSTLKTVIYILLGISLFWSLPKLLRNLSNANEKIIVDCGKDFIMTKGFSTQKLYYANKIMHSFSKTNNYSILGNLDKDTITVTNKYIDTEDINRIKECLANSNKFHLVLSKEIVNRQGNSLQNITTSR